MRKYCGKKLVKKSGTITSECFDAAVDEIIIKWKIDQDSYSKSSLISDMRTIDFPITQYSAHPEIAKIKEEVDVLYLEKLRALPTKAIEDIIWVHDCGKLKRAARTIETLSSELVRRALLGDSYESESKTTSKRTIRKRKAKKKTTKRRAK